MPLGKKDATGTQYFTKFSFYNKIPIFAPL